MDTTHIIKKLVIVELILIVFYVILGLQFESRLPLLLQDYLLEEESSELTMFELLFALIYLLVYPIAMVGLLCTKVWAKTVFIFSVVFGYLILPFLGPHVDHGIPATIDSVGAAVEGAIVALLLFSASAFNKQGLGTASQPPKP